jgi:biotin transport system substrate-specific component
MNKTIIKICLVSLFAALIAGGTFVAIPLPFSPVPIVLQNLFILLAGMILGPFLGASAAALYLLAGAIGLPVFAGATGGIAHFAGPTGGFLVGYFFTALAAGLIAGEPKQGIKTPLPVIIAAAVVGLLVVYIPGVLWLAYKLDSLPKGITAGFLPFLPGDAVKGVIAVLISPRLRKAASRYLG